MINVESFNIKGLENLKGYCVPKFGERMCSCPWWLWQSDGSRVGYNFQSGGRLIISNGGKVQFAKWEWLQLNKSLLIQDNDGGILLDVIYIDKRSFISQLNGTLKIFALFNSDDTPDGITKDKSSVTQFCQKIIREGELNVLYTQLTRRHETDYSMMDYWGNGGDICIYEYNGKPFNGVAWSPDYKTLDAKFVNGGRLLRVDIKYDNGRLAYSEVFCTGSDFDMPFTGWWDKSGDVLPGEGAYSLEERSYINDVMKAFNRHFNGGVDIDVKDNLSL